MGKAENSTAVASYECNQPGAFASNDSALGRLLPLFPNAQAARIPIHVALPKRARGATEKTVIIYRGHDTAIFLLDYPLLSGDTVQLRPHFGPRAAFAQVVALMPSGQGLAVAVRFIQEVPKWLLKA